MMDEGNRSLESPIETKDAVTGYIPVSTTSTTSSFDSGTHTYADPRSILGWFDLVKESKEINKLRSGSLLGWVRYILVSVCLKWRRKRDAQILAERRSFREWRVRTSTLQG